MINHQSKAIRNHQKKGAGYGYLYSPLYIPPIYAPYTPFGQEALQPMMSFRRLYFNSQYLLLYVADGWKVWTSQPRSSKAATS